MHIIILRLFSNNVIIFIFRMGPRKATVTRVRGENLQFNPSPSTKTKVFKASQYEIVCQIREILVMAERWVDNRKINENPSFCFYLQEVGSKEYTQHEHLPLYNEIVRGFYAHLQLAMRDQPMHTIVRDKEFPFTRQEILNVIPNLDVPEEKPSLQWSK